MRTYKAESNVKPVAVDIKSSPTTVYLNNNVKKLEIENPETKEKSISYRYEVTEMSREEYLLSKCEKIESDNMFLAMMTGVVDHE